MIYQMDKARAGMKADAGFDRVESFPAAADVRFGHVVGVDADGAVIEGAATRIAGVALHTHTKVDNYAQYDDVSVMTRGLVWCVVVDAGSVTDGGAVEFNAAGEVQDASAGTAYPNAVFRSGAETMGDGTVLALVELHSPTA
ncbi:MAG: hypothetical protein Unbinned4052contig1001_1 [Prokaryotic dsDNA virus sp.]|nr:MAG: hypothetical protein Unbinned4052contig1001_1 [Prokaryotic dsDNA virus sp.]|tara:strand:+ start:1000 stop:1425 length:426 start_codon:yes stop_codon:yes gene_type:complete